MRREQDIAERVCAARQDDELAEELISQYLPFIRAEAARYLGRICTEQDDELSIAMIAFHDAMKSYQRERGAFIPYASLVIRNRLTDHGRKEQRHRTTVSLDAAQQDDDLPLSDVIASEGQDPLQNENLKAAIAEIIEFKKQLSDYNITLLELTEQTPKQQRSMDICKKALLYILGNGELFHRIIETGKLPLKEIAGCAGLPRKTLERHRKYLIGIMIIFSNGYTLMRGHLKEMLRR
ncbi:MAG TPA: sigma-70 family RNA polymerase sigma factor [Bacillota bacterium]|nr:sigma-70 family RNA polymerase sigma factor [Bacillota bacterium]